VRPACLLGAQTLSTPRSAVGLSPLRWGLLPGAPTLVGTGLSPSGEAQQEERPLPLRASGLSSSRRTIRVIPTGATLNSGGPRITSWRDSVLPDEMSIHLTLIIESDGVSHFSAVAAVPQELACLAQAKLSQVMVRRECERSAKTSNQLLLRCGPARKPEILERH
jgi:hypothetical protein